MHQKLEKKILWKVVFTSTANLKNILSIKKLKLLPNSYSGVYQIDSDCKEKYFSEAKKCVFTRSIKHQEYCRIEKWKSSGATEQKKSRHGQLD